LFILFEDNWGLRRRERLLGLFHACLNLRPCATVAGLQVVVCCARIRVRDPLRALGRAARAP